MKNEALKIIALAILAFCIQACNNNDESLPADPLIGNWSGAHGLEFMHLFLHDEQISIADFGMTVFGLNEESAEAYAKSYLQAQVLGPIDIDAPLIVFKEDQLFLSQKGGEPLAGQWQWVNDKQYLRLGVASLPLDRYDFTLVKLTASELNVRYDATIEIIGEHQNQVFPYTVILKLKR